MASQSQQDQSPPKGKDSDSNVGEKGGLNGKEMVLIKCKSEVKEEKRMGEGDGGKEAPKGNGDEKLDGKEELPNLADFPVSYPSPNAQVFMLENFDKLTISKNRGPRPDIIQYIDDVIVFEFPK